MTDVDMTQNDEAVNGDSSPAEEAAPVTEADIISRGKGMSSKTIADLPEDSPVKQALASFTELVAEQRAAEEANNNLTDARNQAILALKDQHDVSFSAIAEILGNTSSLVLYLYQRAQGMSAKEIREASERSRLAKAEFRPAGESSARKQTPEEKAFRKQQREALKNFLEQQQKDNPDAEATEDADDE